MIRLRSLHIQGFRGIREGEIEGLSDVNILVGRNNCGKSTVAEAVMMSFGRFGKDPLGRTCKEIWSSARGLAYNDMTYGSEENGISISSVVQAEDGLYRLDILRSDPYRLDPGEDEPSRSRVDKSGKRLTVFLPSDMNNVKIEEGLWEKLIKNRSDRMLVGAVKEIFGMEVEQLQLLPDKKLMLLFKDHSLLLDAQGDGTRAALRCLMMVAAIHDTLMIIEEPESHQHPGSLERFALALCRLAWKQGVQLLLTTHSAECVRAFIKATESLSKEEMKNSTADGGHGQDGPGLALFHLSLEAGVLDARRMDEKTVTTLLDTGVDVRFLDLYA